MQLTVFGASGAIGSRIVDEALGAGHVVRAFTRSPDRVRVDSRVAPAIGDLADPASIRAAIEGAHAVIWAVGATSNAPDQPPLFEAAARSVVAAMQASGVRRLVALSGAAITLPGERKPAGGRLMSAFVSIAARHVVEAKRREATVFSGSDLDWTLVRPPRVIPGPPAATYRAGARLEGMRVSDGSLARFMVRLVGERAFLGEAPFISD